MTDDRPSDLLSALPRSRPHRRSNKRPERPANGGAIETVKAQAKAEAEAKDAGATRKSPRASAGSKTSRPASPRTKSTRPASPRPKSTQPASAGPKSKQPASTRPRSTRPTSASRKRPASLPQPAQPRGVPRGTRPSRPEPSTEIPVLRTAVQAAAELVEIGFTLSAKALRGAASRVPRP